MALASGDAVVKTGTGLTVIVALPEADPLPQVPLSVMELTVYTVVADGLTVRVAGLVETLCV